MLSIIGTILGLFGSLFPEILKYFKQKKDQEHEREMFKLQMQYAEVLHQQKVEELNLTADIEESKALYQHAEQKLTGNKFIDGLVSLYNSSVRPTITYAFFALYGYVKFSLIYSLIQAGSDWKNIGMLVWNSEDFAVFSTIMAFWFGGRFLKYSLGLNNK
jgi:hypothetical protein